MNNNIIIDRYQLKSLLGQGGMGRTYEAIDLQTQQQVAIKIISLKQVDDWKKVELIEREAQVLQQLNHPNIPKYLDYFTIDTDEDKSFYLVQQLVKGKSLDIWRKEKSDISEKQIKNIIQQFLKILIYLHSQTPPIIHRDIKPQNIIMGEGEQMYCVDFGAVQNDYYNTIVSGNTVVGTYGYMPVEQSLGKATPASDLYSFGATILYLLTNRSPHELDDDNFQIDVAQCLKDTNVSDELIWWLEKMLAIDLDDRFNNATQALQTINNSYVVDNKKDRSQFVSQGWRNILIISIIILVSGSAINKYKWFLLSRLGYYPQQMCRSIDRPAKTLIYYLNSGGKLNTIINEIHTNPNCLASLIRHKENKIIDRLLSNKNFQLNSISLSVADLLILAEDIEMFQLLIDSGADVNAKNTRGDTSLHLMKDIEKAKILIDNGADVNAKNMYGDTPLHEVKDIKKAKLLIDNGADVNITNKDEHTPLHQTRDFKIAKLLVDNGADVNFTNKDGDTFLHQTRDFKIAKLAIDNGTDVNAINKSKDAPLHKLHNHVVVELLVENGANVNVKNNKGNTPLHLSFHYGKAAKLLIENGADVNAQNNQGNTPLHHHNHKTAKLLIDNGANVNIKNNQGDTPLHNFYDYETTKLLIDNGADVNAQNNQGNTPLHNLRGSIVEELLIDSGADVNIKNNQGNTPLERR